MVNSELLEQLKTMSDNPSSDQVKEFFDLNANGVTNDVFTLGYFYGSKDKESELKLSNPQDKKEKAMLKYKNVIIRKNKNCSTYYARFRIGKKQFYITAYTAQECYNKVKKLKCDEGTAKILAEQNILTNDMPFDSWYNKWLTLYKVGKVKDETLRTYRTLYKYIPDSFKERKISDIKLMDVIELVNSISANRQQQKFHEFLNMIFQKAEDHELIARNPMKKVDKPKHRKVHSVAFTTEQQNKVIETCNKIANSDVILVALYQGFRRGEVLGITRDCVEFEHRTITINKSWSQSNRFDTTKNDQSVITLPMFDKTYEIMLKYKDKQPHERMFDLSIKQYELMLKRIRTESGMINLKMKDMRSTFITNCMNINIPIHIIQAWVGHTIGSVVTTAVYTTHNYEADIPYIRQINNLNTQRI